MELARRHARRRRGAWRAAALGGWLLAAGAAQASPEPARLVEDAAYVCMFDDHVLAQLGVKKVHGERAYHFCCEECARQFAADPQRHRVAASPIDGQLVDKASALITEHDGRAYFLASRAHAEAFLAQPSRYVPEPAGTQDAHGCAEAAAPACGE